MEYHDFFSGKRITLMGLGLLGRGVGDADFLAPLVKELVITDKKSEAELRQSVSRLSTHKNIVWHLDGHDTRDFTDTDMVIKAAGVPLDSPETAAARKAGVPVYMSTALAAKFAVEAGAMVVGVTGTRGKTTVASMIYHTLKKAGKRAHFGGNIRGVSTLALLPDIQKGDILVLELDSWQLQGFGDLRISPQVAVFTNLMPDHLNYYGGDTSTSLSAGMEAYFADKANIFKYQTDGALIVGASVRMQVQAAHPPVEPDVPPALPSDVKLRILGEHNRENAAFAFGALRALGLSDMEIKSGLESFEGVEGRLQLMREVNGTKIYNDNNATTPEATIAALRALEDHVTLIIGGSDKGLVLGELVSEIQKRAGHVILLIHPNYQGSARLGRELEESGVAHEEADALPNALQIATAETKQGVILFSPAFASFGMFKNEYDRNDQFMKSVAAL